MTSQPLYDLQPLLHLMLIGAVIALAPLAWVWFRNRQHGPAERLLALSVFTLFLTFDLVMFGAFTRLTDSGLGCPDWPGCYGNASPLGAHLEITAAQTAMPTGPVTHGKAWVEMIHRYLATGVGVLIIALTLMSWRLARKQPLSAGRSPWWPTASLVWVCIQGAFGALTVTEKLFPAIVTLHLLGGTVLLALLCVPAVAHGLAVQGRGPEMLAPWLRRAVVAALALVTLQVALGGWVSTNYAVLACTTFPTCQGSWWPAMDFAQAFEIWRPLGMLQDGRHLDFEALTAIHYLHRLAAYVVAAALVALFLALRRAQALARQRRWLAGLLLLQVMTGLSNVLFDWPLIAAVLHTGGAAALVGVLVWSLAASSSSSRADMDRRRLLSKKAIARA